MIVNRQLAVSETVQSGTYGEFLSRKAQIGGEFGFEPSYIPDYLFAELYT